MSHIGEMFVLLRLIQRIFGVWLTGPLLNMVAKIYIPVLFPLTFLIALLALWFDRLLGFGEGFIPAPWHYVAAAASFALGLLIWSISYASIIFEGKGSPSPTAGRTQHLVTTGIYAWCRYPSIYGKLFGVQAVGLALNSISFCLILVPLLLAGSLIEKLWRQEPQNIAVFGDAYVKYSEEVPFFIPWKVFIPRRPPDSSR